MVFLSNLNSKNNKMPNNNNVREMMNEEFWIDGNLKDLKWAEGRREKEVMKVHKDRKHHHHKLKRERKQLKQLIKRNQKQLKFTIPINNNQQSNLIIFKLFRIKIKI